MIFSRIVYASLLAGLMAGVLLTSLQVASLNPIILAAETYQPGIGASDADSGGDHAGHSHEHADWAPTDGLERTAYSLLANLLACTGFAAITLAMMCLLWLPRGRNLSWSQGSLWGLAGFTAFFLAPALGMPPEIPGLETASVGHRQAWWLLCVCGAAAGLGILTFARNRVKTLGLALLVLPYIVGAPRVDGPASRNPDPAAVETLTQLHQQFVFASAVANLVVWLVLGLVCRYAFNRWLRPLPSPEEPGAA